VPGPDECSSHRRADSGRDVHGQKLALVVAPLPEPDGVERNRYNDVGRRPRDAQRGRNGQTSQVAGDRGPALVLERVYHGAGRSLELQGVEHPCPGARTLWGAGRSGRIEGPGSPGQIERPGPGTQLAPARCADVAQVGRQRRTARYTGVREQEREESIPDKTEGLSPRPVRSEPALSGRHGGCFQGGCGRNSIMGPGPQVQGAVTSPRPAARRDRWTMKPTDRRTRATLKT